MNLKIFASHATPFIQTPLWLFRLRTALGLGPSAFLLLQVLLDYDPEDQGLVVAAKKDTLHDRTRLDWRALERAVVELEAAGVKVTRGDYKLRIATTYDLSGFVAKALALAEPKPVGKAKAPIAAIRGEVAPSPDEDGEDGEPSLEELASAVMPVTPVRAVEESRPTKPDIAPRGGDGPTKALGPLEGALPEKPPAPPYPQNDVSEARPPATPSAFVSPPEPADRNGRWAKMAHRCGVESWLCEFILSTGTDIFQAIRPGDLSTRQK